MNTGEINKEKLCTIISEIHEGILYETLSIFKEKGISLNKLNSVCHLKACSFIIACACSTLDLDDPIRMILMSFIDIFKASSQKKEISYKKNALMALRENIQDFLGKLNTQEFEDRFLIDEE